MGTRASHSGARACSRALGLQGEEQVKAVVAVQTPWASGSRRPAGLTVGAIGASQITGCVDSSG